MGRTIVFNVGDDPGQWDIATDNEAVVSVQKGGERDGATFNPGGGGTVGGQRHRHPDRCRGHGCVGVQHHGHAVTRPRSPV